MNRRKRISIVYREHEHVSMEKLAGFILACRQRKPSSSLARISQPEYIRRIVVVIDEYAEKSENEKEEESFTSVLRENPMPENIPIYIHATRKKTKKHEIPYEDKELDRESLKKYLVKDIDTLYTEGVDHRLYTIPTEKKKEFYREYSSMHILSEISKSRDIKIVEKEDKSEEDTYYKTVQVNGRDMASFYKNTAYPIVSIDCEMIRTEIGVELARISIIDDKNTVLYDQIVEPKGKVLEYITEITGLSEEQYKDQCACIGCKEIRTDSIYTDTDKISTITHLGTIPYKALLRDLSDIIGINTIIIGHSISHDLFAMNIYHTKIIDTSLVYNSKTHHRYKLKMLSEIYLNKTIQETEHSPSIDASTCIDLIKYAEASPYPYTNQSIQFLGMKNISISTEYYHIKKDKKYHKSVVPVSYIFGTADTTAQEENTIRIHLHRHTSTWSLSISHT